MPIWFLTRLGVIFTLLISAAGLQARIRLALPPAQPPTQLTQTDTDILTIQDVSWQEIIDVQATPIPIAARPVLLCIRFPVDGQEISAHALDRLERFLLDSPGIDSILIRLNGPTPTAEQLNLLIKHLSSLIKGLYPDMAVGLAAEGMTELLALIFDQMLASYLDALVVSSQDDILQERIMTELPGLKLWERLAPAKASENSTSNLVRALLNRPLYTTNTTTLYMCEATDKPLCKQTLSRLLPYLNMGLIDRMETVDLIEEEGFFRPLPLLFKSDGVSPVIMAVIDEAGKKTLRLSAGVYESVLITDLKTGIQKQEKIGRHSHNYRLTLSPSIHIIELTPRESLKRQVIELGISTERPMSAEEIVARARAWMTRQSRRLHSFIADMKVNYSLKVGNLNESFDLLICGPYFMARGEPADWVQQEFYLNRIKWKSKKTPKIPLLQPEKVNIVPLEIDLSEQYHYQRGPDDIVSGQAVFVIRFKPATSLEDQSAYAGRLWIRKKDGAILKKELNQMNLRGEVLSNTETQILGPLGIGGEIWLPTQLIGHQIFNIAGTLTHIEKRIEYDSFRINPVDFETLRQEARQSDSRMVRDTDQGLRYLVKDPESGERTVEWTQSKTQTAAIFGCFYDNSYAFPLPLAGINYLNFDIGGQGKGRQTNILFGGAMLLANYTDPSLFGSGLSFNANFNGIAFASRNRIFRNLVQIPGEALKEQIFKSYIAFGFSLTRQIKATAILSADYHSYNRDKKETAEEFILPLSNLTSTFRLKLDANFKGFNVSLWSEYGQRSRWNHWGMPDNSDYDPEQSGFFRFRLIATKDFKLSLFRKIQTKLTWLDGYRLDRFSAYKFGFFSELRISGFNSGSIRAERALMLNLSYSYQLGQHFGLEFKYDSILISNALEHIYSQYFSGLAVSASTALPVWDNMLVKLEAGLPIVSHGIRGFVLNLMLLKMF